MESSGLNGSGLQERLSGLQQRVAEMDVYTRRRIVAGAVLAAVLLLIVVVASSGGSEVNASSTVIAPPKGPPPLAAEPSKAHVKLPTSSQGDDPFMTIDGRTVLSQNVPNPGRKVALTFDDGPAPLTPQFLDKLDRLKAKASFFVIGVHVGEHPELIQRENAMGMTIGNHSYSHSAMPSLSPADQRTEITRTQGMLDEAIGRPAYFFRFPGQDWDFASARQMAQQGMVGVRFSIDTLDWTGISTSEIVASALQAKPGSVIQMHDGGPNREATLAAIGPIVKGLRRRGFELVTLDELYRPVVKAGGAPKPAT